MFVRAMSGIYIHKSSNKYVVLSLAMLLYLTYLAFSLAFDAFPLNGIKPSGYKYAIELTDEWNIKNLNAFQDQLNQEYFNDNIYEFELINKEEAWKDLSSEFNLEFESNPLNHILVVHCDTKIDSGLRSKILSEQETIKRFETIPNKKSSDQDDDFKNLYLLIVPVLFVCLLLFIVILHGAVQSNLSTNKKVMESLILAGAHHSKLAAVFRQNAFLNFATASMIALVLFFVTIYLIKFIFQVNIEDFSIENIFKSILIPSIVLFALHNFTLLWKVDKYLKSI